MTAQSGLGFSGIVAIQIPDDGAAGEVLTKLTPADYDYDWAAGGGGGGQVNTVVGGTNITVDATDPINPIVNLDAALVGISVNAVTLTALGAATNFLNETGVYSVPPLDTVAADALYLRLDTTNDPLTGILTTQNLEPSSGVRDIGLQTNRYRRMFGKLGIIVNSAATPVITFPANVNHGGLIAGSQAGIGTNRHTLSAAFPAVAVIGNAATNSIGGIATMQASRGGAVSIGSAYAYQSGVAIVRATGYASTCIGYAYGAGTSTLEATNSGSLAFGYSRGRQGTNTALISSRGNGSFAAGNCNAFSGGGLCTIESIGAGAFAAGYTRSSAAVLARIAATGNGSFAQGQVNTGAVAASILASGVGSFAQGSAASGQTISATATNAVQFGPGTNALADSLQVGTAGIRFKGTAGAPGAPQNGDFWVAGAYVYVRSNGVNIQIAGPGPLTN